MSGAGIKRWVFAALGGLFFMAGFIGIFVPVLPTVPFMLLAAWAFSNSSQRLHDYICHHPRFGVGVRQWRRHGAVSLRVKIYAVSVMAISAAYMVFFADAPLHVIVAASGVMAAGALYLLSRPTMCRQKNAERDYFT